MNIDRERAVWAYACHGCMDYMTDEILLYICNTNKDIFVIEDNEVRFTKEFLNDTTLEKMARMS